MSDIPAVLRQRAASKRLIPFVGAGVSRNVLKRNGEAAFPGWADLLRNAVKALNEEGKFFAAKAVEADLDLLKDPTAKGVSLIQVADKVSANLSPPAWAKFLRSQLALSFQDIDPNSLVLPKAIWSLANNFVITTNFDKVLNWASASPLDARSLDLDDLAGLSDSVRGETFTSPTVWHLHGEIDNPTKLILRSTDYDQLYSPPDKESKYAAAFWTLQSILASTTLLFVGFSFADEYIREQLEYVVKAFSGYAGQHFALIPRSELDGGAQLFERVGIIPVPYDRPGEPLLEKIQAIGGVETPPKEDLKDAITPDPDPQPLRPEERWTTTQAVPLLDQLGPVYILDPRYFFVDWNPAFQRIFADQLKLYRGQHAQDFVQSLLNHADVDERARKVFLPDRIPLADIEPLFFKSEKFGVMHLYKIAARIVDNEGALVAWSVALNILNAEKLNLLWEELQRILEDRVNWALYASKYDNLLLNFDEYGKLVKLVCSKVPDDAVDCADFGAGTGNGTLELLNQQDRQVWAIEPYEEWLARLSNKVREKNPSAEARLRLVKQELTGLREFDDELFDAAIMINVLYAVEDPASSLKEIARVLRPGGVLALSTTHCETDIDRLFDAIRQNFQGKGIKKKFESVINEVRERHRQMMDKIHRDTKDDIRKYLNDAGFDVEEWLDDQYAGAVVVVKAVKR
jgi:ubiquinone/menaquinone biosynthesis C-methylase UbiE